MYVRYNMKFNSETFNLGDAKEYISKLPLRIFCCVKSKSLFEIFCANFIKNLSSDRTILFWPYQSSFHFAWIVKLLYYCYIIVLKSLTFQIKNSTWITEKNIEQFAQYYGRKNNCFSISNLNLQKRTLCQAFQRPNAACEQKSLMVVKEKGQKWLFW